MSNRITSRPNYITGIPSPIQGLIQIAELDDKALNTKFAPVACTSFFPDAMRFATHLNLPVKDNVTWRVQLTSDASSTALGIISRRRDTGTHFEYDIRWVAHEGDSKTLLRSLLAHQLPFTLVQAIERYVNHDAVLEQPAINLMA